ncbi:MAG: DNA-binding transcriptional repressor ArsR [Methanomassiliicoccales archaeon PtaU1.Bin124]|nr:MAG: DNA-binding transcriptional repressor ArsR [Methanomassiliicoccales archaeon PtaU1.Bin124]
MARSNKRDIVSNEEACCQIDGKLNLPEDIRRDLDGIGGLDGLLGSLPDRDEIESKARVCKAISDPDRLKILHALSKCDLCPCILKEVVQQSDSKLSYHLDVLEEAGLITSRPQKKWRIYMLTDEGRSHL